MQNKWTNVWVSVSPVAFAVRRAFPIPGLGQGLGWDGVHFLDSAKMEWFLSITTLNWIFFLFIYWAILKCRRGTDCYPERPASWYTYRTPISCSQVTQGHNPGTKMTVQAPTDPMNQHKGVSVGFYIFHLLVFHEKHKRRFYFLCTPAPLFSLPQISFWDLRLHDYAVLGFQPFNGNNNRGEWR